MSKKRDRGTFSAWAAVTRVVGIYTGREGRGGKKDPDQRTESEKEVDTQGKGNLHKGCCVDFRTAVYYIWLEDKLKAKMQVLCRLEHHLNKWHPLYLQASL